MLPAPYLFKFILFLACSHQKTSRHLKKINLIPCISFAIGVLYRNWWQDTIAKHLHNSLNMKNSLHLPRAFTLLTSVRIAGRHAAHYQKRKANTNPATRSPVVTCLQDTLLQSQYKHCGSSQALSD